ncbi:porin family protein [Flavobacterium sp. KJJ]|uniref:porin family protein n=1 Tax=Flavobacterium sp. KJJ TaxID=1270193 RepID=UPI0004936311|nr:porin family protein [Flavobacterium sp. KJJ]
MKKNIVVALALITFGFANAQNVKFGVKGGFNLSSLKGNIENETPKFGFQLGGLAEFKLTDKFYIQPELLFSTQGGKYQQSGVDYLYKQELNSSYLNIPIMAKYYIIDKLSLEAGPQVGFLLSAKGKYEVRNGTEFLSGSGNAKDTYQKQNIGLNIGAGYDLTKNITAGMRYHFGMSNEIRYYPSITNVFEGERQIRMRNDVLSISVGYKF